MFKGGFFFLRKKKYTGKQIRANQCTGFFTIVTFVIKELMRKYLKHINNEEPVFKQLQLKLELSYQPAVLYNFKHQILNSLLIQNDYF